MSTSNTITSGLRRWKPYPSYKETGITWYGLLPSHWRILPTKHVCKMNTESLGEATSPDFEMDYVDIGNVTSRGEVLSTQRFRFDKAPSRARKRVRDGDTIISTVRTYLKAIAYIEKPAENLIVSTGFAVLRPNGLLEPRYLWRSVQAHEYIEKVVTHSTGIGYPAIPPTVLATLPLWVPPLNEQRRIVEFLDRETAKIDALIAKKERLIELLQEKRTALISQAVTKGLDPSVTMKDSGVQWLGQIPAHWQIIQSRRVFQVRNQPAAEGDEQLTASQKYGMIPQTEFMELEGRRVVATIKGADSLRHVEPNDFVISLRSFQGGIEWCKLRGSVTFHYVVLKPVKAIHPPYFAHLFKSSVFIQALRATTDFIRDGQDLRYSHFILVPLPVVTLDEQVAIANHLDRETAAVSALIAKVQEAIDKLREYRSSLISAAVTGKIDVSSEVAPAVEPTPGPVTPAAKPVSPYFRRTVFAAEIIDRLCDEPTFGHVKFQKCLFVAQHHLRVGGFEESYKRMAAGPYDNRLVRSVDSQLEKGRWFKAEKTGDRYAYRRLDKAGGHRQYFERYFGEQAEPLARLLDLFRPMTTDQAEIVATLYAVWNDFLLRGEPCDDDHIVAEVLTNWHDRKKRFEDDRWRRALGWMRDNGLVPTGFGTPTVPGDGGTA